MTDDDPQVRIARAREGLSAKLDELRRREHKVRDAIAPVRHMRHLANPWVRLGAAALAGVLLGARRGAAESRALVAYREPDVATKVMRTAAIAATTLILRRLLRAQR